MDPSRKPWPTSAANIMVKEPVDMASGAVVKEYTMEEELGELAPSRICSWRGRGRRGAAGGLKW